MQKKSLSLLHMSKNSSTFAANCKIFKILCIMAKQSGIHQIRGKVGEHSYYRQSGVQSGLIRSINQGLSARVKNDEAFANTRLNNVEFGGACNVAATLGKMVTPKFRPMVLPFSQSKMAKAVLELAKSAGGSWGERAVPADSYNQLAAILAAQSKRDFTEFVSLEQSFDTAGKELSAALNISADQATLMASLGITHLAAKLEVFHLETGKYNAETGKIRTCVMQSRFTNSDTADIVAGSQTSLALAEDDQIMPGFTPIPPTGYNAEYIAVLVLMPIRSINNVDHVLQEYCSYTAFGIQYTA